MASLAKGKKWDRVIKDGKLVSDATQDKFDADTPKVVLPFILKDVNVYYLQHQAGGQPKMESKFAGDNEYPVQVLITETILKQLKKYHKKISVKEYTAVQFKKQFKVDVPANQVNTDDNYVVIKLSSNAAYRKAGVGGVLEVHPLDAPRVLASDKSSLADTLVGNGSVATIGFEFFTYKHPTFGFGCSVNLKMLRISELIAYVGAKESLDDDEMGFDEEVDELEADDFDDLGGEVDDSDELAQKELAAQAAAQAAAKAAANTDATDDDIF